MLTESISLGTGRKLVAVVGQLSLLATKICGLILILLGKESMLCSIWLCTPLHFRVLFFRFSYIFTFSVSGVCVCVYTHHSLFCGSKVGGDEKKNYVKGHLKL